MSYDAFAASGGGGGGGMEGVGFGFTSGGGGGNNWSSPHGPRSPASASRAAVAGVAAPSAVSSSDETARSWLLRDSGLAHVPDAIKQLQGSVALFSLLPCVDDERPLQAPPADANPADSYSAFASGGVAAPHPSHSVALHPRLHGGDVVEVFARSGMGKTEMLYQCIVTTLLPKSLTSSLLPFRLRVDGEDHGAVLLDCDYRFNVGRLEQLMQARIRRAFVRDMQRHTSDMSEVERVQQMTDGETRIAHYLQSDDYAALRSHCLSCLYVFRAQTPRHMLSVLRDIDECCQRFNTSSWQQRQEQIKQQQKQRAAHAANGQHPSGDSDVAMESVDITDPSFNPRLSGAAAAVAASSRSALSVAASPPRISLLCIDNVASMHWLVKGQAAGFAGMAVGLDTPERMSVSGAAGRDAQASRGDTIGRTWFYELFTQQLRALLHARQLIAIATKPPISNKMAHAIQSNFTHDEFLSRSWNSLVTHRIIIRDKPQITFRQKQAATARAGGSGVADSVLRECLLKDISAASKGSVMTPTALGQALFSIRISEDGITADNTHI